MTVEIVQNLPFTVFAISCYITDGLFALSVRISVTFFVCGHVKPRNKNKKKENTHREESRNTPE